MAQHGIPPFRPDIVRSVRSHSGLDVVVSDMEALHTLPEAMGTKAVGFIFPFPEEITHPP